MKIISCNSNQELAKSIATYIGVNLADASMRKFADDEIFVEINENIRGEDVFIIQSTSHPANDHLMELLISIDAAKRGSAKRITAVIPYYGYARQDRKTGPRTPITAKLVANLITSAGADRVLTMDLHAGQIQGFFDIPLDNIFSAPPIIKDMKEKFAGKNDLVISSPDVGGVARARAFAKLMKDAPLAIIDKRRSAHNIAESLTVIGEVRGKTAILIDDMIDTGGTICSGANLLKKEGANRIFACASHAVFSPPSYERLSTKNLFEQVIVTNSIPVIHKDNFPQLKVLSVANMLGEAIWRIHEESSVSSMFR